MKDKLNFNSEEWEMRYAKRRKHLRAQIADSLLSLRLESRRMPTEFSQYVVFFCRVEKMANELRGLIGNVHSTIGLSAYKKKNSRRYELLNQQIETILEGYQERMVELNEREGQRAQEQFASHHTKKYKDKKEKI